MNRLSWISRYFPKRKPVSDSVSQDIDLAIVDRVSAQEQPQLFTSLQNAGVCCVIPEFLADYLTRYFGKEQVVEYSQYLTKL